MKKIFTPGPTQVHPDVIKAVASAVTYHRSGEFRDFYKALLSKLRQIFLTNDFIHVLTTSGSGSMEAAVVNFCSPGEKVLFLNQGKFGSRWGAICRTYGVITDEISVTYGESIDAGKLEKLNLETYSAVFLTHSETSTSAYTDIQSLTKFIKSKSEALVIVDAITSIGAIEFRMDQWNIDVAVSASQKGLMTPPGLAVIAYNERAHRKMSENNMPRYYFDLRKETSSMKNFQTTWTPAIGLMYGLDKACDLIISEGLERRWGKVHEVANYFRNECREFGFGIFAKHPVDSLSAITFPDPIPTGKLVKCLREKYDIQIANGQSDMGLNDKIVRISHMGDLDMQDTIELMNIIMKEYKGL